MTAAKKMTIRDKVLSVFGEAIDKKLSTSEIIEMLLEAYPDTYKGSIVPSNYCYNVINKDPASFKIHVFKSLGSGLFYCLGSDYPYSGSIYWKKEKVGRWASGSCHLTKDPRVDRKTHSW